MLMGHYGQSQTLGRGQDTHLAESNVTAILEVFATIRVDGGAAKAESIAILEVTGELSHRASIVSIISIVPIHLLD